MWFASILASMLYALGFSYYAAVVIYDDFYRDVHDLLARLVERHDRVVVNDIHSYNHRRTGPEAEPADPELNPEINVGTGTMYRRRWVNVVDRFLADLHHFDFLGRNLDVRENIFSGLLWPGGHLLIDHQASIPARRVQALLQHEVGTHLLTYYNGLNEPFQQLHAGFAGYDALQEGLAVLTEYLVGGLSSPRMRLLAARVVAAHMLVEGASFIETFRTIDQDYDFAKRIGYTVTMRTYRGGGLTKDAVCLRGLMEILEYLKGGGELEPLFVGKIAADHIPLIQELRHRNVLTPPAIRPRCLDMPGVAERLEQTRNGTTVLDLVKGKSK